MNDWNVVVNIYQDGFRRARRALKALGPVEPTHYHNVLAMKIDDPVTLLEAIEREVAASPALYDAISRVAPAQRAFDFQSAEAFAESAKAVMVEWSPRLAGRSFHVRLHRRGGKHELHSPEAERLLDDAVLEETKRLGAPARISFEDPDAVIMIDTVDHRAGLALWTREDLARHRLLKPD
jgi:tRNA(Ser,Leu) C12 N-acetylase TAN1